FQFLTLTSTPPPPSEAPLPPTSYMPPRKPCTCTPRFYTVCSPYYHFEKCDNCATSLWRMKEGGHQWIHYECDNAKCKGKICEECKEQNEKGARGRTRMA